ncbi:unnamed protein product [Effrenium voratum]|nr:unnamed protein product [Effrenium voratum]
MIAHDAGISRFDFNDDRELVATVSHDMSVCIWDIGKGVEWKMLFKAQTDRPLNAVALGPLSRAAAIREADWPTAVCVIAAGGQDVRDVARSSSATEQFGTLLFRLDKTSQLKAEGVTNKGHFGPVHSLAFAGDGSAIASGSEDGFVRIHVFEKVVYVDKEAEHFWRELDVYLKQVLGEGADAAKEKFTASHRAIFENSSLEQLEEMTKAILRELRDTEPPVVVAESAASASSSS